MEGETGDGNDSKKTEIHDSAESHEHPSSSWDIAHKRIRKEAKTFQISNIATSVVH